MSTILIISFSLSILFVTLTHPLSMGLILLLQTMSISMLTGNLMYNYWYSYILFLILVGGMLILFIYMTSIASNEKFNLDLKTLFTWTLLMTALLAATIIMEKFNLYIPLNNNETNMFKENFHMAPSFNKYMNTPSSTLLSFMFMYLFLALIAIVKITNLKFGSLRQKN